MKSYEVHNNRTYSATDSGERQLLANFTAQIIEETRYIDQHDIDTHLTLIGCLPDPDNPEKEIQLPPLTIDASDFPSMTWVLKYWGTRCVITPGSTVKEDLRAHIQQTSRPNVTKIYKHLGWHDLDDAPQAYLHAGGAITPKGNRPDVRVVLPPELQRFNLTTTTKSLPDAIAATLSLALITKPEISWTLLAATFAPLLGPIDFGVHVTGRTGTFKSELASIYQSHYGTELDARHLPGSWSSTANALEALAYHAANALFVVDDFVPTGTSWQVRNYHTTADKLIRAQGNQAGRARLTDTSNLRTTMYPRGLILSTGEDTPEGHSVRARLMILELSPGDITPADLSAAQRNRPFYVKTTAEYITHLAKRRPDLTKEIEALRNENLHTGHTRTPAMVARLVASLHHFLTWTKDQGVISMQKATALYKQAKQAILDAGARQTYFLEAADPCDLFLATLRHVLAAGMGHVRTLNGGIPRNPSLLGFTEEGNSEVPNWKSHGPCLGWIDWDRDELFLDATMGFNVIKKVAGAEMTTTKQTMFKRLKDGGILHRCDDVRQRNTVRVTADGHGRQVLALAATQALDTKEVPQ